MPNPLPPGLVGLARPRDVAPGSLLFLQGDPADRCYYLEAGEVALRKLARSGDEVEVGRIGPGDWFGEAVMFAGRGYPVSAHIVRPSRVLAVSRADIVGSSEPGVSGYFLGLLAQKCLGLNRRIEELTVMDARERVARYLLRLCPTSGGGVCAGSGCRLTLPHKKVDIARQLAMAPETLSRTLSLLERDGLLVGEGTRVAVASCAGLRAIAEDE
jgi:CRP-like cAMP-binding protein